MNCLNVFDNFVRLALKVLTVEIGLQEVKSVQERSISSTRIG